MAYSIKLANRIRTYLDGIPNLKVQEKQMFSGLAFLVNGKMCVNVSHDNLMCRFDPELEEEVAEQSGFLPMIMKGKQLRGYCYVSEEGYKSTRSFEYWLNICLDFNKKAKVSKKKKKTPSQNIPAARKQGKTVSVRKRK
jgi:TfoX/Sxy family transcriptional regulator of competence genes